MRELLYKNMTSNNYTKRDISVQESVIKDGVIATSERRCIYFIKEKIQIDNPMDLVKLAKIKKNGECGQRDFYVLKVHDSKTGLDKLLCKLKGNFYAVIGKTVYCIVFVHSFKIRFEAKTIK